MGFGNSFMRALGFGGHNEEDFDTGISAQEDVPAENSGGGEVRTDNTPTAEAKVSVDPDRVILDIFTTVIDTFNQALPSFLREAVDPEAQKKYLYNQLDKSVKEQLALISAIARDKSEANWHQRHADIRAEIEMYKKKLRQTEEKQEVANEAKLSAERQKRALSERVHDLESKVIQLEADAEQTELEKKSLVNKLKVASVHEEDSSALREEINRLKSELLKSRASDSEEGRSELMEADMQQEIIDLREEVMTLKASLSMVNEELASTRESLENATEDLRVAEEIQNQLEKFEDVKKRQDSRINGLKKKNQELSAQLADTIRQLEDARAQAAQSRAETTAPTQEDKVATESVIAPDSSDSGDSDDALFDVSFDDTAWVSDSPRNNMAEESLDFGYKPPRKKSAPPADDATHQLSLW